MAYKNRRVTHRKRCTLSIVLAVVAIAGLAGLSLNVWIRSAEARLEVDVASLASDLALQAEGEAVLTLDMTCEDRPTQSTHSIRVDGITGPMLERWVPSGCNLDNATITGWNVIPPSVENVSLAGADVSATASANPDTGEVVVTVTATGRRAWKTYTATHTETRQVTEPERAERILANALTFLLTEPDSAIGVTRTDTPPGEPVTVAP